MLVEDRTYSDSWIRDASRRRNKTSRQEFKAAWQRLLDAGVDRLWYFDGDTSLGGDDTTDGSHPSDLGFYRQANAFEPVLKAVLAH